MESVKHKLGTLLLVLCLIAVAAVVWYFLSGAPQEDPESGTLVLNTCEMRVGLG